MLSGGKEPPLLQIDMETHQHRSNACVALNLRMTGTLHGCGVPEDTGMTMQDDGSMDLEIRDEA